MRARVPACVCVCERVRGVGWKLPCSSRDRADPWTRRKDGDCLTSRGVCCPRRRPGWMDLLPALPATLVLPRSPPK